MIARTAAAAMLLSLAASPASAKTPSLEQRVERLEGENAIRTVLIEYGAFLDSRNYAAYAALFAPQGEWIGGFGKFVGPAAIEKMLTANLGPPEPGFVNRNNFHMITNPLVTVTGSTAHATSKYLFWARSPEGKPTPMLAGRYEDDFVRVNGEWKIARRTTYGVIPFRDPAHPEQNEASPVGAKPALSAEAQLRQAQDTLAVQRIIVDYATRLDARDFDGYAALFATDGTWQNGALVRHGPAEIKAMLVGLYGQPQPGFVNGESYHLVSNIAVDVDGDHATGRSRHLLILRGPQGQPVPTLAGRYEDEFVRENGQWKILHRVDYPVMPTPDEWRKQMAGRKPR